MSSATRSAQVARSAVILLLLAAVGRAPQASSSAPPPPAAAQSQTQVAPADQPAAAAAAADDTKDVIIIKYANVSHADRPLSLFKLRNQPLSAAVIESEFATSIRLFDVSRNQLATLPKDLFCPLSNEVRHLNASRNLLENFDSLGLISQNGQLCLSDLRVLDMSHNLIRHLPATGVATLQNLELLDLSHNLIDALDELALSSLFRLRELNLAHNRLQQLPQRIFHKSSSVRALKLQFNSLRLPISQALLFNLTSLEELDLSHNNISAVADAAFTDKLNLTSVDLSHNELAGLRQEALRVSGPPAGQHLHHHRAAGRAHLHRAERAPVEFRLAANPFLCDCQIEWMRDLSGARAYTLGQTRALNEPHYGRIADLASLRCSTQSRWSKAAHKHHHQQHQTQQENMIDLLAADSSNFLCRYKSHCFALCQCCEFDACDCEMLCPAGCQCYYDSTWQTNIIDCSSNNHTVVPDRIPMDVSGLYLDGNNIDSLRPSNLIARKSLKTLYLNSSNLQFIANRTFNGLIELQTLYLHDNMLRSLNGYEFEPLVQLRALYLQSNRLDHINNQTFIYLRSLEILDLSNNRLTASNLDLFWFIGHHNIRLRQLSIAHNWWSCQCNSINRFRQILKQKFLLNGSVNIADKNQLRCYYNSTTVGPLILADNSASPSSSSSSSAQATLAGSQQPVYASTMNNNRQQQQQQQLTEINQCSDIIEDHQEIDVNPPLIYAATEVPLSQTMPPNEYPNDRFFLQQQQPDPSTVGQPVNPYQSPQPQDPSINVDRPSIYQPGLMIQPQDTILSNSFNAGQNGQRFDPALIANSMNPRNGSGNSSTMPLTSFILLSIMMLGIMAIAASLFVFIRKQQLCFHESHHHHHHGRRHKKSSAASTTSVSSSASSTAISSATMDAKHRHHQAHLHQPHHTLLAPQQAQHHLIMSSGSGGATTTSIHPPLLNQQPQQQQHHHHSASSQSNIYAALVSPVNGSSTIVASATSNMNLSNNNNNNNNNIYSNSSTTSASHRSGSSQLGTANPMLATNNGAYWHAVMGGQQQQQPVYGQANGGAYGALTEALESSYGLNGASYKTGSLYNASRNCHENSLATMGSAAIASAQQQQNDWIKLPKVKQFMSKLVNKSLALGGYRPSSRDELASTTSDKIYDAFISYDKRDEAFVMQHLSAELEYGHPQYRVADRYRDLMLPNSSYVAEAITSVIGCSQRTIVVLTESYLASDWCRFELQAALREAAQDRTHKLIAVVLDPKCLLDLDAEMRSLLTQGTCSGAAIYQQPAQLVQLEGSAEQQLVASLSGQASGNQQVSTRLATNRISFINYNERKFWPKIKQLMPLPRPSAQTLTLTTKN